VQAVSVQLRNVRHWEADTVGAVEGNMEKQKRRTNESGSLASKLPGVVAQGMHARVPQELGKACHLRMGGRCRTRRRGGGRWVAGIGSIHSTDEAGERAPADPLESLREAVMGMKGGWVLEVDIRKFYDTLAHHPIREIVRQRVQDGVLLRLISKWLHAGVMEDGENSYPEQGSPQGGVVSPLLANVYLHHVIDEWFAQQVQPRLKGKAQMVSRKAIQACPETAPFLPRIEAAHQAIAATAQPEESDTGESPPPPKGTGRPAPRRR